MNRIKITILFIHLLYFFSCQKEKEEEKEITKECLTEEQYKSLTTQSVSIIPVEQSIRLNGSVVNNPSNVVNYVSLISGVVTQVSFNLGDEVRKGQVLAEVKSQDLLSLVSERKKTVAELNISQQNLARVQALYTDRVVTQKDYLEAKNAVTSLKLELNRINETLKLFGESPNKGTFLIKSPMDGFIVGSQMSSGMQISAEGDPLFTVSNMNEVWVEASVYVSDIEFVKKGTEVKVLSTAYPDKAFYGEVTQVSQVFDPQEKVLKARVVLKNADLLLKSGLFVEVIAKKVLRESAPFIPESALILFNNKYYVLVCKDKCDVKMVEVELLSREEQNVYLTKGIKEGEKLIIKDVLLWFNQLQELN